MIAPATAAPAPRPPTVETDRPGSAILVPTPRLPDRPVDPGIRLVVGAPAGLARPAPAPRPRARRGSPAGWAPAAPVRTPRKSPSTTSASKDLAFLKDPNLSIEEKLMRLLGYLNAKWEKEMQAKLDRIADAEKGAGAKASGSGSKKSKGLLGGLASAAKSVLGAVGFPVQLLGNKVVQGLLGKIGGPVLAAAATALGMPALAPALLRLAPGVLGAVAGAVSGGSAGGGGSESGSGTAAASGMKVSERETIMMEIQRIQAKQKEMFGLVSNILKSNHDIRSSIIANIR